MYQQATAIYITSSLIGPVHYAVHLISGGHFATLRYASLSNIMLGISNSLFNFCNVTITLYAYILVCFLVPLAPKQCKV